MYSIKRYQIFRTYCEVHHQWNEGQRGEKGLRMTMRGNWTEEAQEEGENRGDIERNRGQKALVARPAINASFGKEGAMHVCEGGPPVFVQAMSWSSVFLGYM